MKKVLIQNSCSSLTSGASHSLLGLLTNILKDGSFQPIVVLPVHDKLEDEIKKMGIKVIISRHYDLWVLPIGYKYRLKDYLKNIIRPFLSLFEFLKIYFFLKREHIDLVHINMLTCSSIAKPANILNIPVVWHLREFLEEDLNITFVNRKKAFHLIEKSKMAIAVSDSIKNKYKPLLNININVIYNGIQDNKFLKSKKKKDGNLRICIMGRISRGKCQDELIKAISLLDERLQEKCIVDIWGNIEDKSYYKELQSLIMKYKLNKNIFFRGFTDNVPATLQEYDCLCVCAHHEAFGRTTIEGMLSGCIVIGADSGGTSELITNKKNGFLYNAGNTIGLSKCIQYCMSNEHSIKKIKNYAKIFALDNFSAEVNAKKIIQCYKDIIYIGNVDEKD